MKLIDVLQEIQIKKANQIVNMDPNPSKLIDPDNNDTMASWLQKNKINFSFDKYKLIQHRINASVKINLKLNFNVEALKNQFQKYIPKNTHDDYIYWTIKHTSNVDQSKFDEEWNKYVIKPIINSWQSYFNRICGTGRVKVWIDPSINLTGLDSISLRFIISKPSPADFKMLP